MGVGFTYRGDTRPFSAKPGWSYHGFHNFRRRLAAEIGMDLDNMPGFEPYGCKEPATDSWEAYEDDIIPFINHSDCDGHLSPGDCRKVAPRLRALVDKWEDGYDKTNAILLADMMDHCGREELYLLFV